ncbi:MAG TPA: DUF1444 family protein [Coleofasciculaceae cyanobacterium]|jgi:hypothetical protein
MKPPPSNETPQTLTQEAFRHGVENVLQQAEPELTLEGQFDFGLTVGHPRLQDSWSIDLSKFYACYTADHALLNRMPELLQAWLRTALRDNARKAWSEVNTHIYPSLLPIPLVEALLAQPVAQPALLPLYIPGFPSLSLIYYIDSPDETGRTLVRTADCEAWGCSANQLGQVANDNLSNRAQMTVKPFEAGNALFCAVEPADDYNASRMLITSLMDVMVEHFNDDLLVAVPNAQTLLATAYNNQDSAKTMLFHLESTYQSSQAPLCRRPFLYKRSEQTLYEVNIVPTGQPGA